MARAKSEKKKNMMKKRKHANNKSKAPSTFKSHRESLLDSRHESSTTTTTPSDDLAIRQPLQDMCLEEKKVETTAQPYDYYAVFDVEATCERGDDHWNHEIIEFPVVFLNAQTLAVDFEFHRYVKPTLNPILTDFCVAFTGISQAQVDQASLLSTVLEEFDQFLIEKDLVSGVSPVKDQQKLLNPQWGFSPLLTSFADHPCFSGCQNDEGEKSKRVRFVMATDGPWDIEKFLSPECALKGIQLPWYMTEYVNIRSHFGRYSKKKKRTVNKMLSHFGLSFEGREHSGLDDSRNISRIASELIRHKVVLSCNGKLCS